MTTQISGCLGAGARGKGQEGLAGMGQKETFRSEKNILFLDCGGNYLGITAYQNYVL